MHHTQIPRLEKLGFLVSKSMCCSQQVQENVVCLIILCSLWCYEVKVFASPCTSLCTKSNRLWKEKCWNKFRYSYIQCHHLFLEWLWVMIFKHVENFHNKSTLYSSYKKSWVVGHSFPIIGKLIIINTRERAKKISTYGFSTCIPQYIPHNLLKFFQK